MRKFIFSDSDISPACSSCSRNVEVLVAVWKLCRLRAARFKEDLKSEKKGKGSRRQVGFRRNDIGSKQDPPREIVSANKKAFYDLAESGRAHKRDGRYLAAKYSTFLP